MCGIFGVFSHGLEASRLVHTGLWALQHRGQEGSGIVSSDGNKLYVHRGMGLVASVYTEEILSALPGNIAIGHNRYSTSGGGGCDHLQPVIREDRLLALAHNGNLPTTDKLEKFLASKGINTRLCNDSELMRKAVSYYLVKGQDLEVAVKKAYPLFTGVFSCLFMTADKIVAVRDRRGIRPLSIGRLNSTGIVISSETCALDIIGAKWERDIKPGEMIVVDKNGLRSFQLSPGKEMVDIFELIYFARPDSIISGVNVNEVRKNLGRQLAKEISLDVDIVIPIPDSAIPAAIGFSEVSGIPFDMGIIKNRYIHRTFIRPAQSLRESDIKIKLNPLSSVISGKKIALMDDSIVRGTTSKEIVAMLKRAGAKEVHFLVSSPPVKYPDFYGIDTPRQNQLIAAVKTIEETKNYIQADSLNYLSYKGMIKATKLPKNHLCTACFSGEYPISIGSRIKDLKII